MKNKRWKANILWHKAGGEPIDSQHDIFVDEVDELDDFVEAGPTWEVGMTIRIDLEYQL